MAHRAARRNAADAGAVRRRRAGHVQRHLRQAGRRCLPAAHRAQHRRRVSSRHRRGGRVGRGLHRGARRASRRPWRASRGRTRHAPRCKRVAEMHVHHPRSPLQKFVTVTAGLATVTPRARRRGAGAADRARAERRCGRPSWNARGALASGRGSELQLPDGVTMASTPDRGVVEVIDLVGLHRAHFVRAVALAADPRASGPGPGSGTALLQEDLAGDAAAQPKLRGRYAEAGIPRVELCGPGRALGPGRRVRQHLEVGGTASLLVPPPALSFRRRRRA